jgi:tetratricopeptide (TPR) repeat protein
MAALIVYGAAIVTYVSLTAFQKVLRRDQPLNVPLLTMNDLLGVTIRAKGVAGGRRLLSRAKRKKKLLFTHDFSPESFNALAEGLAEDEFIKEAIGVYQLSLEELPLSGTYYDLGQLHLRSDQPDRARKAFEEALTLWPENEAAQKALDQLER